MRMREFSETIPKPMVPIGSRPLLWHLMKYYASHGHKEFILCLGYRGDVIKNYFINYDECVSNDFVLTNGAKDVQLLSADIADWKITFVDTGLHSNIGQRLLRARRFLDGDDVFLANYADGLSDLALPTLVDHFNAQDPIACFVAVRPMATQHLVAYGTDGVVTDIHSTAQSSRRINGGFFVLRKQIFDYMNEGEELVEQPFRRLIDKRKLLAYQYDGFWACVDTFKERQQLDELYTRGAAPWEVWRARQD